MIFACFRLVFRVYLNTYFCISSDPIPPPPFIFYFLSDKSQLNILELLYNPFSDHSERFQIQTTLGGRISF